MRNLQRILALLLCLCALAGPVCASGEENPLDSFTLKHGSRESKKVAITVDDCYKTATEWIEADVELCKQYGIHMTFFPLYKTGCLFPEYRELWQSVLDAGCEIGCHGYQHLHLGSFDYWTLVKRLGMWRRSWTKPWAIITKPGGSAAPEAPLRTAGSFPRTR